MANKYSAQNIAAYFIYEMNERQAFINNEVLQHMLAQLNRVWTKHFGQSAFIEEVASPACHYSVEDVYNTYAEAESAHIDAPAKEWTLPYGKFQLVYRTIPAPKFTADELRIVSHVARQHRLLANAV
ncbi:MAG: hypothetical protein UHX00_08600 [Caryophanon sp.]|nr:hypothetical protein [Caryophanon sp.]